MYGQVSDFKSVLFGIEVYKFAHEMQIVSLTAALDDFFNEPEASDVFAIFNIYQMLSNQPQV